MNHMFSFSGEPLEISSNKNLALSVREDLAFVNGGPNHSSCCISIRLLVSSASVVVIWIVRESNRTQLARL